MHHGRVNFYMYKQACIELIYSNYIHIVETLKNKYMF